MALEAWDLEGKMVLVTGAEGGWIPVLAGALAQAGARVAVAGPAREVQRTTAALASQGLEVLALPVEAEEPESALGLLRELRRRWGAVHILVNDAQSWLLKPVPELTLLDWDSLMARTARRAFLWCQAFKRQQKDGEVGRVVNLVSGLAVRGLVHGAAFCASQGAVLQLTRALALEWARANIKVNAVAVGWFDQEEVPWRGDARLARFLPLRRLGRPEDVGALVVYLASPASDFITGQVFFVDGGAVAHA